MTLVELAKELNVSVMTVSRAMNPNTRHKVAQKTLKKIDDLVKKHGYTANLAARNLRVKKTYTVGVAFPYLPGVFYSFYYNQILAAVSDYFKDTKYDFKLLMIDDDAQKWDNYDFKNGEHIDGLILVHWFKMFSNKKVLKKLNIPAIIINDAEEKLPIPCIAIDHVCGGRLAAETLYEAGHRKIAVMQGPTWSDDNKQRMKGFYDFLNAKGICIDKDNVVCGDYFEDRAYHQANKLLCNLENFTAIFCCNDQMAYGLMRKLDEKGLNVPNDISLIGYDDDPLSKFVKPSLTTIHTPIYQLSKLAAQRLYDILESDQSKSCNVQIERLAPTLVRRNSIKKI